MRGMPQDCLSEVWTMAHPQVEGLERASRISLYAQEGDALPALQGRVLDLLTLTHNPIHTFFWRLDYHEESLKLVLAEGMQGTALCLHTTEEFLYVLCEEGHFYRIPRCDNTFIYAATTDLDRDRSAILVEIDVKHDVGRYRTIYSGEVHPPSATILNGKATLFWLDGWHPRNAYKWTRGGGGPGSKDTFALFHQHHAVEFTSLTLSNRVGWLGVGSLLQERVWQVDLATEAILAVFQSSFEPYGIRARPDGGLWADLLKDSKEVLIEVWKPVFEPRPHKPIMMRRIVPTTT
ncbi:hypothetical protein FOL46_006133 [Perkinsus olseni]|nr:hypothetical protein FOL46_006133 [Perkinsus olseni]